MNAPQDSAQASPTVAGSEPALVRHLPSNRRAAINRLIAGFSGVALTTTLGSVGVVAAYYPLRHAHFEVQWLLILGLMTLESAGVHLPSEVILPAGGWLIVRTHGLGVLGVVGLSLVAATGNTIGSSLLYAAGSLGGRRMVRRYGHYFLIHESDLDRAERRLRRGHGWALLATRVLPVVRTYAGFCAGTLRVPLLSFLSLTFLGSFAWCLLFVTVGALLGSHWSIIRWPAELVGSSMLVALLALLVFMTWKALHADSTSTI